ncbi:sulfotransferase domain-containing protein [Micromonospora sp. NBC_01655]|uniref:sulfotransferase domain-containing protein n=1 Tax=Micromonospora sp. NBC_01655 TaxID=2975983 RepID=UPI00225A1C0B|nr:sulfotransferase domain-containing protein [Micromonospora sp. NBC_01655]MCX4473074.1 sulfotransferase domain-containing protein [Micromonospora sp. NBC_01655]
MDSGRWEGFPLREGDIVVSTPAKCGTTWTQTICALLIFQTPELPARLDDLTYWLDMLTRSRDDIFAFYEAQRHRRFIKTHTPFDGLPIHDGVTYVAVGRDPRDVAISWDAHSQNVAQEAFDAMLAAGGNPAQEPAGTAPAPAESAYNRFWAWLEDTNVQVGLPSMLHHLSGFWAERERPNVLLLHYDDLKSDLEGQMRFLAGRLGIEVPESRWPDLVRAATFDSMRGRAEALTPVAAMWSDPKRFFNQGVSGQWRDLLDEDDLRRYEDRVAKLAEPDLIDWLHRGPIVPAR